MFLSNASIRRPVAMASLLIGLSFLGFNAYRTIQLEFLPKLDIPYVTVVTVYPGGSPEEIETDIAKRIEDVVISIEGLKHITSIAMEDMCQTTLEFTKEVDLDIAANDVREKIDLIMNDFPLGTEKPKVLKFDVNALPVVTMALTGEAPVEELYDYADNQLRDRLSTIGGVAEVQLIGGAKREVHVLLDREKLAARGLASTQVVEALQRGMRTIPSGKVREEGSEYVVKYDAEYKSVGEIGGLELVNENGARTYLRDIARVEMTTEEVRQNSDLDGKPAITVKVVKKSDANAVEVVNEVRGRLAELRAALPGGMRLEWISDDGVFIQAAADSATSNILQGVLLTALILFLFLYNVRTTIIVGVTMPLTIVIGLFFMALIGYTLNMSTLLAIGLSVGILVTNSIVVLESILTRFQETNDPVRASRVGASEVGIAVLASAGTNVVVLFPIAMMRSQVGAFFAPFAWSMVIMTLSSLFISFTLTPLLCSVFLKPVDKSRRTLLSAAEGVWNAVFDRCTGVFVWLLRFFEHNRPAAAVFMVFTFLVLAHAFKLAGGLGFNFFPDSDRGNVFVKLEYPTRYDLANTTRRVREVQDRLRDVPGLKHTLTTIGKVEGMVGQSSEGVYLAQLLLCFPQRDERPEEIDFFLDEVRRRMEGYTDAIVTITTPSTIGGQGADIEVEIAGDDLNRLDNLALALQKVLKDRAGFVDPDTNVRVGKPELRVTPARPVLSDLGIPATGVGMMLRANLEGLEAGVYKEGARNYDIVVKLDEIPGKDQVREFLFPGPPGQPLLMTNLGDIREGVAPVKILRKDKMRISKLYINRAPEKPLGDAVAEIQQILQTEVPLPAGYKVMFPGEYEMMGEAGVAFAEAGLIAIILVYLTLAAIMESFLRPFIILLTLPLGLVGVIWSLWITGETFTMMVMLGVVMLIGIVVNNAILIMDSVGVHRSKGMTPHEAMILSAREQFRPIVMITAAAILGMLPLALDKGIGAEPRTGIGIASVGGIAISAVMTLLVIPITYSFFTRDRAKGKNTAAPGASEE